MDKSKVISYPMVKTIIGSCNNTRTQAILAFQYAMANRIGELAKKYWHDVYKKKRKEGMVKVDFFVSDGIRRDQFFETADGLEWVSPNFKSKKQKQKRAWILKNEEPWLYNIMRKWLETSKDEKYLFNLKVRRLRQLVNEELKKYDKEYGSHCLRHSRATHLAQITKNVFVVKEVLGHARLETSQLYISIGKETLKKAMSGDKFEDILGKRV